MRKQTVSAIIITKNESLKIRKCIESVLFCDEIIILDSGSTDNTLEIAKEYSCCIYQSTDWQGFGVQKQRALDLATSHWIFSIDADEVVSNQLREALIAIVNEAENTSVYDAYSVRRINKFLGKILHYGGWGGDVLIRFGKRDCLHYTTDKVHESLLTNGKLGHLNAPLFHEARESLREILEKQTRYILLSCKDSPHRRPTNPLYLVFISLFSFCNYYFLRLGFLDGYHGFFAAASKAQGKFWKNSGL